MFYSATIMFSDSLYCKTKLHVLKVIYDNNKMSVKLSDFICENFLHWAGLIAARICCLT